jgi:hypothetical protein
MSDLRAAIARIECDRAEAAQFADEQHSASHKLANGLGRDHWLALLVVAASLVVGGSIVAVIGHIWR